MVQSAKNSFAPINRIPPEILSLIPEYIRYHRDQDLIALTHVCRGWREIFTSRSSLWTRLDFTDIDKTRAYIHRSQSSPLKIYFGRTAIDHAFTLIIPHIHRLKSLTIKANILPETFEHFRSHTPLLEKLCIDLGSTAHLPRLDNALFDGDLSSLSQLRLSGVITDFPWKNLANLRVVNLRIFFPPLTMTQLLDFFECAPSLHTVKLTSSVIRSSNAPPRRMVPLRRLEVLTIDGHSSQSIILHHLHIPIGASLTSRFSCHMGGEFPLSEYLPERSPNLENLSHTTSINLRLDYDRTWVRLSGPSGSVRVHMHWPGLDYVPCRAQSQLFHSLDPIISTTERLAVLGYQPTEPAEVEDCPIFQTLSSANKLRTLILTDSDYLRFTRALDPEQNTSNLVLCPTMEEFVLYSESLPPFGIYSLIVMARNRALRGAKLSSITFINLGGRKQRDEVLKLREYVTHVEYTVGGARPAWDDVPCERVVTRVGNRG